MNFLGRAALFLLGVVLLAPGACALMSLPIDVVWLVQLASGKGQAGDVSGFVFMAFYAVAGLGLGALGIWLLRKAVQGPRGR